ncbi:hypothetical protein ACVNF4_27545 [Streptomyces sp. S6]
MRTDLAEGQPVAVEVEGVPLRRVLRAAWAPGLPLFGPAAELPAVSRRGLAERRV